MLLATVRRPVAVSGLCSVHDVSVCEMVGWRDPSLAHDVYMYTHTYMYMYVPS